MSLINRIMIQAPPEAILDAAYHVERWPALLPHYRQVRILRDEPGGRVVEMAARLRLIPLRWTARQWKDEQSLQVYFHHVSGPAKGMDVVWELEPATSAGSTRVTIEHFLTYPVPLLGPFVARFIVGELFIRPVASRTLACFKHILEGGE